ncbi:MAG: 2-oxo acid dehydrogenase subunit E2 [Deltaproteobacteria bacterium]|nr:2-oxo acid dehydrogenase subunit E2 [Deltaproteobacteria bacterium]
MSDALEAIPLTGLRAKIGQRMLYSVTHKPHVTLHAELDATALLDWQRRRAPQVLAETGHKLTLTALLVQLVGVALRRYPRINGRVENDRVQLHRMVNVGVAVALDEGLAVPVVRDAERKSLAEIAAELGLRVAEARAGKLKPRDVLDATFTVSNLGPYGVTHFTPIVNPPEIAILGVGCVTPRPRRSGDRWIEVPMLNLDLSFDHAAIDGAQAARFLQVLSLLFRNPESAAGTAAENSEPPNE